LFLRGNYWTNKNKKRTRGRTISGFKTSYSECNTPIVIEDIEHEEEEIEVEVLDSIEVGI
jgi:hypothetical protein